MISAKSSAIAAVVAAAAVVRAQDTPLASQHFTYTALPYQADTSNGERGPQAGYNICNSTTEGQESLCQTAFINSIDDFCLWGPSEPNSEIGVIEGEAVAWCTKPGRGTRVIPKGTFQSLQFMKTPDYVQVTGLINQANIYIAADDSGGEMDPHGADQRGNPMGGLLFSNAFAASNGDANNFIQAVEWHNFMGSGEFCLKACDPAGANAARLCEHVYDRIGCHYNAPSKVYNADPGVFESCQGDSQDFPGIYTGADGVVTTYQQPPESLGPIQSIPYDPKIPASSNCQPVDINTLFQDAPAAPSGVSSTSHSASTHSTSTNTRSSTRRSSTSSSASSTATNDTGAGFRNAQIALGGLVAVGGAFFALF